MVFALCAFCQTNAAAATRDAPAKAPAAAAAVSATAPDAGGPRPESPAAAPRPFDPADPASWRAEAKLGEGRAEREALIADLTRPSSDRAQAPLTRAEAQALLDDPRAQLVYGAKTVSIVAPSMVQRQRREHIDLLKIYLTPERIAEGVAFVRAHGDSLARAEAKHGVDKEAMVSILMWETRLGSITGEYVAFNSFVSQAYFVEEASAVALRQASEKKLHDAPRQAARVAKIRARARANLLALVRGCKAQGIDPFAAKGSWAGALGYPQFMPASLRWAEDGDGDGKIDLYTFDDAIASVARYLHEHGWAKSRSKAVYAYNNEEAYVSGVLAWADALKKALDDSPAATRPPVEAKGGEPKAPR